MDTQEELLIAAVQFAGVNRDLFAEFLQQTNPTLYKIYLESRDLN